MRIWFAIVVFFALSLSAWGQAALVAHGIAQNSAGTLGVTVPATGGLNMTGANFIHICTTGQAGALAPGDSSSNVYTLVSSQTEDGDFTTYAWISFSPTVTSSMTFTAGCVNVAEVSGWSGIASGPDKKSKSVNGYTKTLSSGNLAPTNANELLLSCFGTYTAQPNTVNSPMTLLDFTEATGTAPAGYWIDGAGLAYQIQGGTSTIVNPTWTTSTASLSGAVISSSFYSQESPAPLTVTTTNLPEGFLSHAYGSVTSLYSNQLMESGGAGGPYIWSCPSTCALPAGLSLSSGGLITGTPTSAGGPTSVTFEVADGYSNTATVTLPMTIASTAFTAGVGTCTGTARNGTQNSAYGGCSLSAAGGTSPYSFVWADIVGEASLPEGLSLNSSTGAISGTDYGEGAYITPFKITDSLGSYATPTVQFSMAGNNVLGGCSLFPADAVQHLRIDSFPVDTSPAAPISSYYLAQHPVLEFGAQTSGAGYTPNGIPWLLVPSSTASNTITTTWPGYGTETSFPPYSLASLCATSSTNTCTSSGPIPLYNPVEDTAGYNGTGQDQHTSTLVQAGNGHNCQLAEQYQGFTSSGAWVDTGGIFWPDLTQYTMPQQAGGSADAAGLPIAPFLLTYDEVTAGAVKHAIRFVLPNTLDYHVWPAVSQAGLSQNSCSGGYHDPNFNGVLDQANPPTSCTGITGPMGEMYRLTSAAYAAALAACPSSTNPEANVIITALRQYGIILADNGNTAIIGTPDSRWNDTDIACVSTNIIMSDFEPVNLGHVPIQYGTAYEPYYTSYQTNSSTPSSATQVTGAALAGAMVW